MSLKDKKLFLLDMDGTLYIDEYVFPGTREFLAQVKSNGGHYAYLTNNSSKGKETYVAKLARLGIESAEDEFLTSVDATIDYLKSNYAADSLIYACGTKSFVKQLNDAGLNVTTDYDSSADIALLSYDTEITYKKIEDITKLIVEGKTYIATHPDMLCPSSYGMAVDIGCYINMLEEATGKRPFIVGKPKPQMALTAMKKFGCTPEETCIIGDRLHTDIMCGINAGIDTVFVLSGDHKLPDIERLNIHPSCIFKDIEEVYNEIK